jgi:hypothetical protein
MDAVDTAGLRDATMFDAAGDRNDVGDARDTAAPRDTAGGDVGAEVGDGAAAADSRDAADRQDRAVDMRDAAVLLDTGKPDGAVDTAAVKDTATEAKKPDGARDLPPAHGCSNPILIPMDNPHVDLALTTTGASHHVDLPCVQSGPDVVLLFSLAEDELVYADTFGATWNTVLFFSDTCPAEAGNDNPDAGFVACSDDACNTTQSQAVATFHANDHYLILSGANGESGDVTLHFSHAPVGSGPLAMLAAGTASLSGTTDGLGPSDVCQIPGPTSSYWWITCPDYVGGDLTASTCKGAAFDTVLSLQIPRADMVLCNDDYLPCGMQSYISATVPPGAGINVLMLGGSSMVSYGSYSLTYTRP